MQQSPPSSHKHSLSHSQSLTPPPLSLKSNLDQLTFHVSAPAVVNKPSSESSVSTVRVSDCVCVDKCKSSLL